MEHTCYYEMIKDFAAPSVALVGIIVTGTMAGLGLKSFAKFKREKIEERRIEVALDALTLAYETKFVFETIRARAILSREYEDAADENLSGDIRVSIRTGQRGAYAVMKRVEANEEFFERILKIEPRFMAVFGAETENIFTSLYSARAQLANAAEQLFDIGRVEDDDDERTREERRGLRELIFRGPAEKKEKDKIGDLVDGFRIRIETICRPIVDQQYGKAKSTSPGRVSDQTIPANGAR